MHENPHIASAAWYFAIWLVGFLAGFARILRSSSRIRYRHIIGVCGTSGFLSFAIVTLVRIDQWSANPYAPLGVAALIGVTGKDVHDLIIVYWLKRLGIASESTDRDKGDDGGADG